MRNLVVVIPGEPFAQPRARTAVINGHARIYDPKPAKNWKATAQQHMRDAVLFAFSGDVNSLPYVAEGAVGLYVTAFFTCPKSDARKREIRPRRWHTKRPDGDNVLKAIKDAAKGVLWIDDSQVCLSRVEKIIAAQGEAPRVELTVRALGEYGHVPAGAGTPPAVPGRAGFSEEQR